MRNGLPWEQFISSSHGTIGLKDPEYKHILCDPQTSGGLLIAVTEDAADNVASLLEEQGLEHTVFGFLTRRQEKLITVV